MSNNSKGLAAIGGLIISALATLHALAGPDISTRTYIPAPGLSVPTVVATEAVWAAMGAGAPTPPPPLAGVGPYPVTVSGPWNGSAFLDLEITPPSLPEGTYEEFGSAIAIQGYRIAIGVPDERSYSVQCSTACFCCWVSGHQPIAGGKVRLYLFDGTEFQPERTINFGSIGERFGQAVALERWNLLAGSPGSVPGSAHLFDPDTGSLIGSFNSPDATGADQFGLTVALDDDLAIVGAPGADTVYVYRDDGAGTWLAAGTLTSPGAGSEFGAALAADGNRIIVGAPGVDAAYIFEDTGGSSWPVTAQLTGSAGSDFGRAVAITGDTAFVGAPLLSVGPSQMGAIDQFDRDGNGDWPLVTSLASSTPTNGDNFGIALAASDSMLTTIEQGMPGQYAFTSAANTNDVDGDGIAPFTDNCPDDYNPGQEDFDLDEDGDACDTDDDNDFVSDIDEIAQGSDPLNPDTDGDGIKDGPDPYPTNVDGDGDGVNDPDDNCITVANPAQLNLDNDSSGDACDIDIDGDNLRNDDEVLAGTDPYNPDTDGDGRPDGSDAVPLDPEDGWGQIQHIFNLSVRTFGLGDSILLVGDSTFTLHAFVATPTGFETTDVPLISGAPIAPAYAMNMRGNRALIATGASTVSKNILHIFDWDQNWTHLLTLDVLDEPNIDTIDIKSYSADDDLLAINVQVTYDGASVAREIWVYEIIPGGLNRLAVVPLNTFSGSVIVSGDTVFYRDNTFSYQGVSGAIRVMEAANGFTPQLVHNGPGAGNDQIGTHATGPAGPNALLVSSNIGSFWLENNGGWALTPTGIGSAPYGDEAYVDPARKVVVYRGIGGMHAQRLSDGTPVGGIANPRHNNSWQTNGRVIIQSSITEETIDIFPLDGDDDGVQEADDNCPAHYNPDQTDTDGDGIGDACDNPWGC